jgi:hypothetical protein
VGFATIQPTTLDFFEIKRTQGQLLNNSYNWFHCHLVLDCVWTIAIHHHGYTTIFFHSCLYHPKHTIIPYWCFRKHTSYYYQTFAILIIVGTL